MTSLVFHSVLLSQKAEVDQFIQGLNGIRNHPEVLEPLFVACASKPPTSEDLFSVLEFDCVDERIKEYFTRYVCAEGKLSCRHLCKSLESHCCENFLQV